MDKHKYSLYEKYLKRTMDFILATLAIIILSPIILCVAIVVRIKLGTPILFSQERPGRDEKIFKLYKFRTMSNEKDHNGNFLPDEKRLGSFGKLLRSTSLDELPSLINIIKGDMSIVGPRPLLVSYLERYDTNQSRRHEVRPGFTGYAQVNGRNSISWEEKLNYDVEYVDNITFWGDLRIICKTFMIVLKREGITSKTSVTMEEFKGRKYTENNTGKKEGEYE